MANVELLERTLAHIEENPELWDQECWFGGPADRRRACFAGRACLLTGREVAQGTLSYVVAALDDEGIVPVAVAARRELDLSMKESLRLFNPGNSLEELREIVGFLCS